MELLLEYVINGQLPRKSNSRQIVKHRGTGKPLVIKSKEAREYEISFDRQVIGDMRQLWGSPDEFLFLEAIVYYKSNRSDLSIELLKDVMQKSEIIKDDRYIKEEHAWHFIDKDNPRVEIRLWKLGGERLAPFILTNNN